MPKLKWLKENLPESWKMLRKTMDLTDFLTYRSSGRVRRSGGGSSSSSSSSNGGGDRRSI